MLPSEGDVGLGAILALFALSLIAIIVGIAQIYRSIRVEPRKGLLYPAQMALTLLGGAFGIELGWLIPALLIAATLLGVYTIREDPGGRWLAGFGVLVTWGVCTLPLVTL